MYNDFVLIGPKSDPAKVAGGKDIVAALQEDRGRAGAVRLARRPQRHARGRAAPVEGAGIDLEKAKGPWYRDTGSGHGAGAQHRSRR